MFFSVLLPPLPMELKSNVIHFIDAKMNVYLSVKVQNDSDSKMSVSCITL